MPIHQEHQKYLGVAFQEEDGSYQLSRVETSSVDSGDWKKALAARAKNLQCAVNDRTGRLPPLLVEVSVVLPIFRQSEVIGKGVTQKVQF